MSSLTPAMDAVTAGRTMLLFGSVAIDLPNYQLSLLDGSGELTFGGRNYVGKDGTYGTLSAIDDLTEGAGDEAPRISITLLPSSDAAADDLASADMQGSLVMIHMGAVDPATGLVVPDPDLCFLGELDVPVLKSGPNHRELEYEVASAWERFFSDDEGIRLSPGWHRSVWPDESGLDDISGVTQTDYWGTDSNNGPAAVGAPYNPDARYIYQP